MNIPRYWCPRCAQFKKRFQVRTSEYRTCYWCAHCGEEIVEVERWLYEQAFAHFKPRSCETCDLRKESGE